VLIDGQILTEMTPRYTFRMIGMVGPDLPLMRGTLRRNLTYRQRNTDAEELRRVVFATGLDRVLTQLPEGLMTWLVESGRNLSAGQRQLIALGRAMIGNPPILLLDEPTAGLDAQGKADVRRTMARYHGTVLLASHDPAELALADQVWVLERGRVIETLSADEYRSRLWLTAQREDAWHHVAVH
ncbi:MAG: ATP-binding cassette domain-containing protein, partial [Micromonosporaceae bacterium]